MMGGGFLRREGFSPALKAVLIGVPLLVVIGSMALGVVMFGAAYSPSNYTGPAGCSSTTMAAQGRQNRTTLTSEQLGNATAIVAEGRRLSIPPRGLVIALATALQESNLRNIPYGDRDSVGLFQQRNAWGSTSDRLNPAVSARMFFTGGQQGQRGLLDIQGWETMPLTQAAQAVQVSAFPNAYAKWESLASGLIGAKGLSAAATTSGCSDVVRPGLPTGPVGDMLSIAMRQLGDPYVWGAVGPDGFDCSGLIVYSWRQAGYQVKVRTAAQMYNEGTPVPAGQERPGDMYFGSFNTRVPGAGHVMIVVKPGLAIQAPRSGDVVKLTRYDAQKPGWKFARFAPDDLVPLPGHPDLAA